MHGSDDIQSGLEYLDFQLRLPQARQHGLILDLASQILVALHCSPLQSWLLA